MRFPRSPELMNREDSALLVVDAQEKLLGSDPGAGADRVEHPPAARRGGGARRSDRRHGAISGAAQPDRARVEASGLGSAPDKLCFSAGVCGEIFERWQSDSRYRVLVCGIETHVCVLQTALDLAAAGFEPYVAVDAVGARYAIDHETALRRMESAGVILTTTETAMFEWCRTAEAPEFKTDQRAGEGESARVSRVRHGRPGN